MFVKSVLLRKFSLSPGLGVEILILTNKWAFVLGDLSLEFCLSVYFLPGIPVQVPSHIYPLCLFV